MTDSPMKKRIDALCRGVKPKDYSAATAAAQKAVAVHLKK